MKSLKDFQKHPLGLALFNLQGKLVAKKPRYSLYFQKELNLQDLFFDLNEELFKLALLDTNNFPQGESYGDFYLTGVHLQEGPYLLLSDGHNKEETLLHSSLDKLKTPILDSIPEMVILHDEKMNILWANRALQDETRISLERMVGRPCYQIFYQKEKHCYSCPVFRSIRSQTPKESILLFGDSYRHIRSKPLYQRGVMQGIVSFITDITNELKTERIFQENRLKIKKLHQVSFLMDKTQSEDAICQLTVEAAELILDLHVCSLDLVEGDYFIVKATSSGVKDQGSLSLPITEGIGGKCLREGKTFVGNIHEVEEARPAQDTYRSVISIPIGKMGIFQAISYEKDAFSQEDVELADLLISHTRESLKRIRTEMGLKELSFRDALTNLYNRSFFTEELQRLDTERMLPFSIINADVNGLKLVNDNFGHMKGDRIITKVGEILKRSCRSEDIIARCGGDEFNILLPQTSFPKAQSICNRIRKECQKETGSAIPITIALGVATKIHFAEDICWILKKAEERMYEDKYKMRSSYHEHILAHFLEELERRNLETKEHRLRLEDLAQEIGKKLNLSLSMMKNLYHLILLHDIGLISLSHKTLNHSGLLSMEDWYHLRKHPSFGYRIVRFFDEYLSVADAVLSHHERWDGLGYPHGLKGEEIPLSSRIFSILDSYLVMTQKNLYRKPLSKKEAIKELKGGSGTQFDPHLIQVFLSMLL